MFINKCLYCCSVNKKYLFIFKLQLRIQLKNHKFIYGYLFAFLI